VKAEDMVRIQKERTLVNVLLTDSH
jgi:hypothetical protein